MSKETRPAFMLYASDWLTGTAEMTLEEKGIFIDMLCHQWLRGDLPSDEKKLSRMLGGDANRNAIASVSHKFRICESGGLQNAKLEQVRESSRESQNRRSAANKANADKRWEKSRILDNESTLFEDKQLIKEDANRNAIALQMESESISEYESENRNENRGSGGKIEPRKNEFDLCKFAREFVTQYGKQGKIAEVERQMAQAWIRIKEASTQPIEDSEIAKGIMNAAKWSMAYDSKAQTETKYRLHPETWLKERQYETDWETATEQMKLTMKEKVAEFNSKTSIIPDDGL